VTGNIFNVTSRNDRIYIEPIMDGLSVHGAKLLVIKNIELILNYHNYKKETRLTNSDTAKGFTIHLSNVNWNKY
jgi:hypothetical protein